MLSIINCLFAEGRTSKCFCSALWLSRPLLWRLNLGLLIMIGITLSWKHYHGAVRHPWGPNSPQQLVYKFVPSIVEFPLRDPMVHLPGPNDVRMSPFCWLTILRGCPKNSSQLETFSKICCKSLFWKYFWENLASWLHTILVGHLRLATLKPIIIHSLIPINVDLLWKVSKRDAGGMLLLYFTFSHFVCNQQKATHSTFTN